MKKLSQIAISLLCLSSLGACATGPEIYTIGGRHYIAGDDTCKTIRSGNQMGVAGCYDKKGAFTGWRPAMTDQEIQMYIANRQAQANYMMQMSDQGYAQAQGALNRTMNMPTYTPPYVAPVEPRDPATIHYCYNLSGQIIACKQVK